MERQHAVDLIEGSVGVEEFDQSRGPFPETGHASHIDNVVTGLRAYRRLTGNRSDVDDLISLAGRDIRRTGVRRFDQDPVITAADAHPQVLQVIIEHLARHAAFHQNPIIHSRRLYRVSAGKEDLFTAKIAPRFITQVVF